MTIVNGQFQPDSREVLLDLLVEDAKEYFGDDLNDEQLAVIRLFYTPPAERLEELQNSAALILSQAQIDFAEGRSLDLLTALIGVPRNEAVRATGEVTFSRAEAASVDYTIPSGTVVQTEGVAPVRFETTDTVVLEAGQTEVSVSVRAESGGADGNVGSDALTVMPSPPMGIEEVTNNDGVSGGVDREEDEDLRFRAKNELSEGMRSTAIGVRNQLLKVEGVQSVSLFINDTDSPDGDGLPARHTEYVVQGGGDEDVGQALFDSKAACDGTAGGIRGTKVEVEADIGNGQTHTVEFSRPTVVQIYVEMDLNTTDEYGGDESVKDEIVRYIGGVLSSGNNTDGKLGVGDDVIYTKVLSAIMSINGIDDVESLDIGTSSPPSGSSNISIDQAEMALVEAGDITINE